jgi:hypothetical protein
LVEPKEIIIENSGVGATPIVGIILILFIYKKDFYVYFALKNLILYFMLIL